MRPRIIARLDIKGPKIVKGVRMDCIRPVEKPDILANRYYKDGADEMICIDVVASLYGRNNLVDIARRVSNHIFIPLTVGGGVRSLNDISLLLRSGADKIAINTWLIDHPGFVTEAAKKFGSQSIVASVQARRNSAGCWVALYNYGRELSDKDAVSWAVQLADLGAGEILLTSVDQDGTMSGFDLELIRQVAPNVDIPVIACGGAGETAHVAYALREGLADAVALASALHYGKIAIREIKAFLDGTRIC